MHTLATQPNGQFQFTFTIPKETIAAEYEKALQQIAQDIKIEGFRKGKAPIEKVRDRVDQGLVYEKIVQKILPKLYSDAITEEKLQPIISPQIRLVSAQPDLDWQIEATSTQIPPVDLKDSLKKLKGLLKTAEIWTPEKGQPETKKPESTENSEDQKITKIIEHLLKETSSEIPPVLVHQEVDRSLSQLINQLQKLGLSIDQYLASTNQTGEKLREDYTQRAIADLKIEFILLAIAQQEKIDVANQELDQIIDSTQDQELKDNLAKDPQARLHIHTTILKRKIVEHLLKLAQ